MNVIDAGCALNSSCLMPISVPNSLVHSELGAKSEPTFAAYLQGVVAESVAELPKNKSEAACDGDVVAFEQCPDTSSGLPPPVSEESNADNPTCYPAGQVVGQPHESSESGVLVEFSQRDILTSLLFKLEKYGDLEGKLMLQAPPERFYSDDYKELINDILDIFLLFAKYENGEIDELDKLRAIAEILNRRTQSKTGTAESENMLRRVEERVNQLLALIDAVSPTKGGEQQSTENVNMIVDMKWADVEKNHPSYGNYGNVESAEFSEIGNATPQGNVDGQDGLNSLDQSDSKMLQLVEEFKEMLKGTPEQNLNENLKENLNELSKFLRSISQDISKDITEIRATRVDYESQDEPQVQAEQTRLAELKEMAALYQRPVIHKSPIGEEGVEFGEIKQLFDEEAFGKEAGNDVKMTQTTETSSISESFSSNSIVEAAVQNSQNVPKTQLPLAGKVAVQVSEAIIERIEVLSVKVEKTENLRSTEFKVTLNPEHLGKVTIKLTTHGTKMSVLIITANDEVRDLIMARMQSVRVMVQLTGVVVERYEVLTQSQYHAVQSAAETGHDILDDGDGGNEQGAHEQGESESDDGETVEVSFAEVVQAMF